MQTYTNYLDWALNVIRSGKNLSWIEERRLEWVPLAVPRLQTLLDGRTFLLITDDQREWFMHYIIKNINKTTSSRPLLPFVSLKSFFPNLHSLKSQVEMDLLEDMLNITFPNGYIFFYIGSGNDARAQIAKRDEDSFMWIFDEHLQNSFYLDSRDDELDIKLIQLYTLMEKTIDSLLFSEVL